MMKEKIKTILLDHYGADMVNSILSGRRKPNLEVICDIEERLNIPAKAWKNIKSYMEEPDNFESTSNHI
ncbi:MAG: hypothetical protein ABXS93_09795 [Sulfurimonas sp.]